MLGLESGSLAETVEVLVAVPAIAGVTVMVTPAEAPFARLAMVQVTVVLPEQFNPGVGVADTKVTLVGSGSVMTTLVAAAGPLFLPVRVYVKFPPPMCVVETDAVLVMERSAPLAAPMLRTTEVGL